MYRNRTLSTVSQCLSKYNVRSTVQLCTNYTRCMSSIQFRYGANRQSSTSQQHSNQQQQSSPQDDTPNYVQYRIKSNEQTVEFEVGRPFKYHKIDDGSISNTVKTSAGELIHFFTEMTYYRRFEIVADMAYKQKLIRGFCHLYDGQEAIITGLKANVKLGLDSLITSYRDHAWQLAVGDSGNNTMAELFGKQPGCARGKGGSMHMYYPKNKFYGGNGIVGAQIPLGAGLALSHKLKQDGGVAITAYGDGASNQGQVFEAFNMAKLYNLPCIFLCENNEYGMGTSVKRSSANTAFYTRGDYIPGIWIDGMDVLACKQGFEFAYEWCRSGKGPIVVEASTYRYHGHSMSDPGVAYRTRDEVDQMRSSRDPIEQVKQKILSHKFLTEAEIKNIEKTIRRQVDQHLKFATNATELSPAEIFTDIYANGELPGLLRPVDFRLARDSSQGIFDPLKETAKVQENTEKNQRNEASAGGDSMYNVAN